MWGELLHVGIRFTPLVSPDRAHGDASNCRDLANNDASTQQVMDKPNAVVRWLRCSSAPRGLPFAVADHTVGSARPSGVPGVTANAITTLARSQPHPPLVLFRGYRFQVLRPETGSRTATLLPDVIHVPAIWYVAVDGSAHRAVHVLLSAVVNAITVRRAERPLCAAVCIAFDLAGLRKSHPGCGKDFERGHHQYHPSACSCDQAPQGVEYLSAMYRNPHLTWTDALLFGGSAAVGILSGGSDCGMPYAPDCGLSAVFDQPLSRVHSA